MFSSTAVRLYDMAREVHPSFNYVLLPPSPSGDLSNKIETPTGDTCAVRQSETERALRGNYSANRALSCTRACDCAQGHVEMDMDLAYDKTG